LPFETFLYELSKKLCGYLTIERRVGESVVDVPNQRVRYKLWVCARKLLPVETLTALSRDKESHSENISTT